MPWRTFTPKREKVSGGLRTLHREELLKPYATANVTALVRHTKEEDIGRVGVT
jgi:hypothetical protein